MKEVVIISAVRTPIGNYMGALRDVPAYDLVALVLNEAVKRAKVDPVNVDDVVMGQCYQSGEYVNIARMGLLTAGWPDSVPGITVDRRCPSGGDAVCFGAMEIMTGTSEIVVAGGVESMSNAEFYIPGGVKWGVGRQGGVKADDSPRGHGSLALFGMPLYDRIQRSRPMHQPVSRYGVIKSNMAWAENAGKEHNLSREEADRWALRSHQRACAAQDAGKFKEQIVPVPVPQRRGEPKIIDSDEGPRHDTSIEALSKLKPVLGGLCTAGNSATENDAAAAFVLTTAEKAKELGVEPMAFLTSFAFGASNPLTTWKAAPVAVNKALKKAGITVSDIGLFEIQEAFSIQVISDFIELGIPREEWDKIINVNGSGIALGHPLGATLALRLVNLVYELRRRNGKYGLTTTPGAGGIGTALIIERR